MPITINGVGTIGGLNVGGLPSGVILSDTIAQASFAASSDIAGVTLPTGIITSGTAQLALSGTTNQGSIGSGFFVTGPGIPPGTTVTSGAGTFVLGLSQNANAVGLTPLAQGKPYTFYKPNAIVTPGTIGGQLCRAWVNFDGTAIAGGTSASGVRAAYNISSITKNGTGDYTVNFTTAMPDANYASSGSFEGSTAPGPLFPYAAGSTGTAPTLVSTTQYRLRTTGPADANFISIAFFR